MRELIASASADTHSRLAYSRLDALNGALGNTVRASVTSLSSFVRRKPVGLPGKSYYTAWRRVINESRGPARNTNRLARR